MSLTPQERADNQANHFARIVYNRLVDLNNAIHDARKNGAELGVASELELLPVIEDVKTFFRK